jgi:hypothetical protein
MYAVPCSLLAGKQARFNHNSFFRVFAFLLSLRGQRRLNPMKTALCIIGLLLAFAVWTDQSAVGDPGKRNLSGDKIQMVFTEPDVSKKMDKLNWGLAELREWKLRPIQKVNNGVDGKFNLTVKVLNVPKTLVGVTPRLKICPVPNEPDRCWDQDVLTPISQEGVFKCRVYLRLDISNKHVFKFKVNEESVDIVIDEKKS